ncbi:iron-sulfur cluster assembly scaffold protein [Litorimonas cladophorae]|uniref:Iron-sulfur cluster assembly scaffold protein n=1 Tax=Litorimonas cladophorae TaxID=1220491 RepID=A0A918KQB7_9PROT|nr:iron-sulfur cluster assembly scaffold protein [Litorimonas cladophorae]GGX72117.1 iron-sulfur cluster assembly scaffold protein [Litorimonas cladophorae]
MFDDLYNADILGLSATLKNAALDAPDGTARKVSKLCGSWLEIDLKIDDGVVTDCAMRVQACALGQASAAILKASIIGANLEELVVARDGLRAMLRDGGDPPAGRFARLSLLAGVAAYLARHTSTLLAFEAAVLAFEAEGQK